nr:MAG TPA: hypothetical protein [Caudoviricetes sp.]
MSLPFYHRKVEICGFYQKIEKVFLIPIILSIFT